MRVCHIIGSYRPVIGGAERGTETLTSALKAGGEDVIVLTRRLSASDAPRETIRNVPVYRLGHPGRTKLNSLTFGLQAVALLATRLRGFRMLHVQDIDTSTFVGMAARLLPGRRLVTTIHGEWPIVTRSQSRKGRLRIAAMVRATDVFTSINPENTRVLMRAGVKREDIRRSPTVSTHPRTTPPATTSARPPVRRSASPKMTSWRSIWAGLSPTSAWTS